MRQRGARRDKQQRGAERSAKEKIHRLLRAIEGPMQSVVAKARVTDYIRLMQLERELDKDEGTTEIKVTWVEPTEAEHSEQ